MSAVGTWQTLVPMLIMSVNRHFNCLLNRVITKIAIHARPMEQHDAPDTVDTFNKVESWPTIEQIESR